MVRVQVYTRAGIEILADMEEGKALLLVGRWSEARSGDDGVISLAAMDSGRNSISHVLLSEIAAIRYAESSIEKR